MAPDVNCFISVIQFILHQSMRINIDTDHQLLLEDIYTETFSRKENSHYLMSLKFPQTIFFSREVQDDH